MTNVPMTRPDGLIASHEYDHPEGAGNMWAAFVELRDGRIMQLADSHFSTSGDGGVTWSEQGESRAGDVTTITFVASPTDRAETLIFVYLSRNHSLDVPDEHFAVGFDEIMEQDRMVVEDQDPLELPLDPREELHLKLADGASIVYRRLLRELAAVPA